MGLPELVVIGGVAVLLFGPSKIPELGKSKREQNQTHNNLVGHEESDNLLAFLCVWPFFIHQTIHSKGKTLGKTVRGLQDAAQVSEVYRLHSTPSRPTGTFADLDDLGCLTVGPLNETGV